MRINKNCFPYPTLNAKETLSSYVSTIFNFDYIEEQDENNYYLKNAHIVLSDNYLTELLNDGKIGSKVIVECSNTVFREVYNIEIDSKDIIIPIDYLRGNVEISCFIYAKEEIKDFKSDNFDSIYGDYSFNIDKYDILAIDNGYNIKIETDESENDKVSSIFSVVCNPDENAQTMLVEVLSNKLRIILPNKEYGYYVNMKNDDKYRNIFFSILAIPTLNYALTEAEKLEYDEALLKYDWLSSVKNAYLRIYEKELEEDWKKLEFDVAQKLLDCGVIKAIDDFYYLLIDSSRIGGDNDE